ncbi:MAG: precorrin-3B synthase [Alphaproteobacteria bacterium]|nr:precorrin-3B synthase [Alphaproteobacteria bacterium]
MSLVRGACPGLSDPMPTGDGWLVRLTPQGHIGVDAFVALCALARQHGNGMMEITPRGNVQVRGLTPQSAPAFADAVAALRIASASRVPALTSPLPEDPDALIDADAIASVLTAALDQTRLTLAPKVSVAIDGGGRLHLDAVPADVKLRAVGARLHVTFGGEALGTIAQDNAVPVTMRLLQAIAAHGPAARARDAVRDVRAAGVDNIAEAPPPPVRRAAEPIGLHPLRDGRLALGVALAFGQAESEALARLASSARDHGTRALRPAPGRALLLIGLDHDGAARVVSEAEQLGFITRADDPRRRVAACAGKPACASAFLAARALAAALAPHLPRHGGAIALHISGCPKGCAHPAPAALTVVGDARGAGIVRDGSAAATPQRYLDPADLVGEIARAMPMSEAAHG